MWIAHIIAWLASTRLIEVFRGCCHHIISYIKTVARTRRIALPALASNDTTSAPHPFITTLPLLSPPKYHYHFITNFTPLS